MIKKSFFVVCLLLLCSFCFADMENWKKLVPGQRCSVDTFIAATNGLENELKSSYTKTTDEITCILQYLENDIDDYELSKTREGYRRVLISCSQFNSYSQQLIFSDYLCLDMNITDEEPVGKMVILNGIDNNSYAIFAMIDSVSKEWLIRVEEEMDVIKKYIYQDEVLYFDKKGKKLFFLKRYNTLLYFDFLVGEYNNPQITYAPGSPWRLIDYDDGGNMIPGKNIKMFDLVNYGIIVPCGE